MNAGKFRVSLELLKQSLSLPDDITIFGIELSPFNQTILIYAASKDFPEVAEGALIAEELRGIVNSEKCEHGGILKRWIEWTK